MDPISPCKGCAERTIGCHGRCEMFRKWREERDKINELKRYNEESHRYSNKSYK